MTSSITRPVRSSTQKTKPRRTCFRKSGRFGSPRLIIVNGTFAGLGAKFSAEMAYVSNWQKGFDRSSGIRGLFTVGLSGFNLTGGRLMTYPVFLLGLHGAVGIAQLYRKGGALAELKIREYTPRVGLDLHTIAFGFMSLVLMGGYVISLSKEDGGDSYRKQHGAYVSIGAEFFVAAMGRYLSPLITVTYSGYQGGRHELSVRAGLRF